MSFDDFSRFVFEYLAFISHLKNNLFIGASTDRVAIQSLKRDERRQKAYRDRITDDDHLAGVVQQLIEELNRYPLHNSSHDLDYPELINGGTVVACNRMRIQRCQAGFCGR